MKKLNYLKLVLIVIFACCDGFNELLVDKTTTNYTIVPKASLSNTPANPSNDTDLDVTVSGDTVMDYQYKLVTQAETCTDNDYNGTWISVGTPITSPIGGDDDYKLCVIGRNSSNNSQNKNSATEYIWTKGLYWKLEVTTTDINQNMTIDLMNPVDIYIDWGDSNTETTNLISITHSYSTVGVYTLKIRGQASRIYFTSPEAKQRLTRILTPVQGINGINSFAYTFQYCTELTGSIPAGLFNNNPQVTSFKDTFLGCTGLTGSIPAGLFDNNPDVTSFQSTFYDCSGLTGSIPVGLFDNNPDVTSFLNTFRNCSGLTGAIPVGLFDSNNLVSNFQGVFLNCSNLTSIPAELFDNNTLVTTFELAFKGTTSITSDVPELWDSHPGTVHVNCFTNVNNALNYVSIPTDWGGP